MEEGSELLEQLSHADKHKFPMFTSCCPGWVRFMKSQYPDMVGQLSTSKSPHEMFGAVIKTYFAQKINVDPSKIFVVSIMPCTAKKAEAAIPNLNDAGAGQDVDVVLTVREMDRMIKAEHILPQLLKGVAFDQPLEKATGAGVIFGATGGVLEAALRSAYFLVTKKNPDADAFKAVRSSGLPGVREAEFEIAGTKLRVAAVSGLGNTRELIEKIRSGEVKYDFVEVMACPGGCAGGGGQPIHDGYELAYDRSSNLYALDKNAALRFSHENPDVQKLYTEFFGSPLSEKAEKLLHTDHFGWEMPLAVAPCCRK
jgi:NADH-quinone oxidoreductase subunit G